MTRMTMHSLSPLPETDEDESSPVLSPSLLRQYSSQESLIYQQIHKFLQECKQSVQRFVALHNFGVGLNLPTLLGSLTQVERAFSSSIEQKRGPGVDPRMAVRHRYEQTFNKLVVRMSSLLTDIFQCEQQFKESYFGQRKVKQKQPDLLMLPVRKAAMHLNSAKSSPRTPKMAVRDQQEQEDHIRHTLHQQLRTQIVSRKAQCTSDNITQQNLLVLNQKVDHAIRQMQVARQREAKLIQLFNINRRKSLNIDDQLPTATPSSNDLSASSDHDLLDLQLEQSCRRLRRQNNENSQLGCLNEGNFKKSIPILRQTPR